jgi:uncharacterized membrane protein
MGIIIVHSTLAIFAIVLGLIIFLSRKGTSIHRQMGRVWVTLLVIVASTAIFIQVITPGQYSYIHLLIPFTLGSLARSIWAIRKFKITGNVRYRNAHIFSMIGVYVGALVVAGAFTLMPGRIFHQLIFG